jgi:hypothetical protein
MELDKESRDFIIWLMLETGCSYDTAVHSWAFKNREESKKLARFFDEWIDTVRSINN